MGGAGAGRTGTGRLGLGRLVPETMVPPMGTGVAAESSRGRLAGERGLTPPLLPRSTDLWPAGEASRASMSAAEPWERLVRVTVALVMTPLRPETVMEEG